MPALVNNLLFLGAMGLLVTGAGQNKFAAMAVFVVFCLAQLPVCFLCYKNIKFRRALGFESVYLMTNFFLALIFRLVLRGSALESYGSALGCFVFFWVFNAVHWAFILIYFAMKRRAEGPPPKNPEDLRYGLIKDEDNREG